MGKVFIAMDLQQLWHRFGQGQNLFNNAGQEKAKGMLFFYTCTGCDVISTLRNKENETAWQTWDIFPDATPV